MRNLDYDEEARLTILRHNNVTKFEFGYGFDGGRRWTKEIAADKWSWFPCGVACSAGELVEMQSTLAGSSWSTVSTNLKGPGCSSGLARGGTQWVLKDLLGRVSRSTDGSGNTVATAIFDMDGVARYGTGTLSSAVIRDTYGAGNEDGLNAMIQSRGGLKVIDCLDNCLELHCKMNPDACFERCALFCIQVVRQGCDALSKTCLKLRNKWAIEICLNVYLNMCFGR
jgi:hypothetical protein